MAAVCENPDISVPVHEIIVQFLVGAIENFKLNMRVFVMKIFYGWQ